jgi:hypothetical protein
MLRKPKKVKLPEYLIMGKLCDGYDFCLVGFILNETGVPKEVLNKIPNDGYYCYNTDVEDGNIIYNVQEIMEKIYNINQEQLACLMEKNDKYDLTERLDLLQKFLNNHNIEYYL